MSDLDRQAIANNAKGCSEEDVRIFLNEISSKYLIEEILNRLDELEQIKSEGRRIFGL